MEFEAANNGVSEFCYYGFAIGKRRNNQTYRIWAGSDVKVCENRTALPTTNSGKLMFRMFSVTYLVQQLVNAATESDRIRSRT